jgi:MFS family permease
MGPDLLHRRSGDHDAIDRLARRRFGIKNVFILSVGGFTAASALCGSATTLTELVIYRTLQGICGAGLIPLSQSTLLQINPPERHGQAMAVFGIGTILGRSAGRYSAAGSPTTTTGVGYSTSICQSG